MYVVEFTKYISRIGEVVAGVLLNFDKRKLNDATTDCIKKDLAEFKPRLLYHFYSNKEMIENLMSLKDNMSYISVKEVITNDYNLGIIRELKIGLSNIEMLKDCINDRFKYYIETTFNGQNIVFSYNPKVIELEESIISFDKGKSSVSCKIFQSGIMEEINRLAEIKNTIQEGEGLYIIYDI